MSNLLSKEAKVREIRYILKEAFTGEAEVVQLNIQALDPRPAQIFKNQLFVYFLAKESWFF